MLTQLVIQILIAVLAFGLIIFIHELGHFLVAKSTGVAVHEFALGMGPRLLSFRRGETVYALRLIPIGGFVQMEGEDEESDDPRSFGKKKVWQRFLIVSAGAVMNILLGFFLLLGLTIGSDALSTTTLARFNEGATSNVQLQENDRITHINGARVRTGNDIVFELVRDEDGLVDMQVIRDGERLSLPSVPFLTQQTEDGRSLISLDFKVYALEKTPGNVLQYAFYWTLGNVHQVWASLIDLVTGHYGISELSGPVGVASVIGEAVGEARSVGVGPLFTLVALITINIGIFNLLPVPALDGGRLVFLLIEAIRRKPIPPRYEAYVHAAGLIALFALMIVVTVSDVIRLI